MHLVLHAGDSALTAAIVARCRLSLAAVRKRAILKAWHLLCVAASAERQAATIHVRHAQAARKAVIAAQFHRLWHVHASFHTWADTAKAAVAAAAEAAATEAEAAKQRDADAAAALAKLEIAAQFHQHYRWHQVLLAWQQNAAALKAQRSLQAEQACRQARIDAVLERVRAAQQRAESMPQADAQAEEAVKEAAPQDSEAKSLRHVSFNELAGTHVQQPLQAVVAPAGGQTQTSQDGTGRGNQLTREPPAESAAGSTVLRPIEQQATYGDVNTTNNECHDPQQFEAGLLKITTALTDSMRAARRMASRSAAQPQAGIHEPELGLSTTCGQLVNTADPTSRPDTGKLPDITGPAVVPDGSHHAQEEGAHESNTLQAASPMRMQTQHAPHQPSQHHARAGQVDSSSPSEARTKAAGARRSVRELLHAPSSDSSSPLQEVCDSGPCDAASPSHPAAGGEAGVAGQQMSALVSEVQAAQPLSEDASWEEYVSFLEREFLDTDVNALRQRQPTRAASTGGQLNDGACAVDGRHVVAPLSPAKLKKLKRKDAQDAIAAQLARIQAAAGEPMLYLYLYCIASTSLFGCDAWQWQAECTSTCGCCMQWSPGRAVTEMAMACEFRQRAAERRRASTP